MFRDDIIGIVSAWEDWNGNRFSCTDTEKYFVNIRLVVHYDTFYRYQYDSFKQIAKIEFYNDEETLPFEFHFNGVTFKDFLENKIARKLSLKIMKSKIIQVAKDYG